MTELFKFTEGTDVSDSEIYKLSQNLDNSEKDIKQLDKPITKEVSVSLEKQPRSPENNGEWDGERGNSKWRFDSDYTPIEKSRNPEESPYSNPDNLTWGELYDKYNVDGTVFKDGYPVFDEISRGTVKIDDFETGGSQAKNRNFAKADLKMAEEKGCSPQEVKEWRHDNNHTWHECEDTKTMQKVPNEIHANVPHDGGRSQNKEENI